MVRTRFEMARRVGVSPLIISSLGVILGTISILYIVFMLPSFTGQGQVTEFVLLLEALEIALMALFALGLIHGGYWLSISRFDKEQRWWVTLWCVVGLAGIVSLIALIQAHQITRGIGIRPEILIEELLLGAGGGATAGLLIGISTAQSRWHANQVERQRDSFVFLNRLLRHNVLNGIQIIDGHADRLQDQVNTDEELALLKTIRHRNKAIADLIQNARVVAQTFWGEESIKPVNLSNILEDEIETAESSFDHATFDVDIPSDVYVEANNSLPVVFDNLLTNAVEHNDVEDPNVSVNVKRNGKNVKVLIEDNGPGIPDAHRNSLFKPGEHGDSGLGLYLVETLIQRYGGDVWVEENEPRGSVFVLELPANKEAA